LKAKIKEENPNSFFILKNIAKNLGKKLQAFFSGNLEILDSQKKFPIEILFVSSLLSFTKTFIPHSFQRFQDDINLLKFSFNSK